MDARGPLSPRASAFSIASLVAAEATERTAHPAPGSSEPVKPLGSPAGMHFSTVTRDMEGEPPCCVWAEACQTPAPGAQAKRAGGIGGDGKGSTGRVSARLPAWTLGRRGRAASCPNPVPPSPGDPATEIHAAELRAEEGVGGQRGTGETDQRESAEGVGSGGRRARRGGGTGGEPQRAGRLGEAERESRRGPREEKSWRKGEENRTPERGKRKGDEEARTKEKRAEEKLRKSSLKERSKSKGRSSVLT